MLGPAIGVIGRTARYGLRFALRFAARWAAIGESGLIGFQFEFFTTSDTGSDRERHNENMLAKIPVEATNSAVEIEKHMVTKGLRG